MVSQSARPVNQPPSLIKVNELNVTKEHIIPVNALYNHFKELYDKSRLTENYILWFMQKLHIAIITKAENKKFSDAHLTRSMPKGWWNSEKLDPFERYRAVGLNDEIWAKI